VKGILVNIFGGIMKCDIIADGIVAARARSTSTCRWWSASKAPTSSRARTSSPERPADHRRRRPRRRGAKIVAQVKKWSRRLPAKPAYYPGMTEHRMKLLVAVKRVIDYNVKPRVKMDGSGVDLANVKMSMNPFDEIAVEEAIRLKEKGVATEIVAVSIGPPRRRRRCAPRWRWAPTARSWSDRRRGRAARRRQDPRQDRRGRAARHDHPRQAGDRRRQQPDRPDARRAARLAAGHVRLEGRARRRQVNVTREVDGGLETVQLKLPAVVTTDLRLNEPRYASLPNIMKAKSKPLANQVAGRLRRRHRPAARDAQGHRAVQAPGGRQGRLGRRADRQIA
jgi:electron transfer flavoprotein beta subunit